VKKLLLSTAILVAPLAAPALAQDASIFREAPEAMEIRASDFLGMRVYATETAVEGEEIEGVQEGWEDIGEINDIVMNRDGQVQAVLVDIGGFLGIGERTVALSMDSLQFVSDSATAEDANDFFLVANAGRGALEAAPEYVTTQTEGMSAEQAATETEQAVENGATDVAAAGAAAGAAVGAAVEGTENAGQAVVAETGEVAQDVENAAEATGETVADAAGTVAEGAENAVEETGEEVAQAGQEVTDEVSDAGAEVSEEVAQTDMTDAQEDQAEVADAQADATAEATEETAQANAEATDEAADTTEMAAEGTLTESEAATEETAQAATEGTTTVTTTEGGTEEMAATEQPATEATTEGEVANTEMTSAETTGRTPVEREGFVTAAAEAMTAETLQGAAVYDANDERVGEVGEIVLSPEGQVQQLVIDVGGFLGIGEKPVAMEMSSLDILQQDGGDEIRVYVSQTEEELEAMPRYEAQQ
jgi:sporulation protein YlmC with PRC-barrel domain